MEPSPKRPASFNIHEDLQSSSDPEGHDESSFSSSEGYDNHESSRLYEADDSECSDNGSNEFNPGPSSETHPPHQKHVVECYAPRPTRASFGNDRTLSATTAIHLDKHAHISDDEDDFYVQRKGYPDNADLENTPPSLHQLNNLAEGGASSRKLSDGVSTLPDDDLAYYRSQIPGRSPLSSSHKYNQQTGSRQVSASPKDAISNSYPEKYPSTPPRNTEAPSVSSTSRRHQQVLSGSSPTRSSSGRPIFRNPSSVRAMQLSSSSPRPFSPSPLSGKHHRRNQSQVSQSDRVRGHTPFAKPPRSRAGTPNVSSSPSRQHPNPKKEYPLMLLHCTLHTLNSSLTHSDIVLEEADCPAQIRHDLSLLDEKLTPTVLERGVLISHPGEDYELLEERVLESLELQKPRIGACGHFRSPSTASLSSNQTAHSKTTEGRFQEKRLKCADCNRHIHSGMLDDETQAESRRWEVRVYAANGLMRAGAWSAAWSQMEKVDVEVGVWMPANLRRRIEEVGSAKLSSNRSDLSNGEQVPFHAAAASSSSLSGGQERYSNAFLAQENSRAEHHPNRENLPSAAAAAAPASTAACSRRASSGRARPDRSHSITAQSTASKSNNIPHNPDHLPLSTLLLNYLSARKDVILATLIGVLTIIMALRSLSSGSSSLIQARVDPMVSSPAAPLALETGDSMPGGTGQSQHGDAFTTENQSLSTCNYDLDAIVSQLRLMACRSPPNAVMDSDGTTRMTALPSEAAAMILESLAKGQERSTGLPGPGRESETEDVSKQKEVSQETRLETNEKEPRAVENADQNQADHQIEGQTLANSLRSDHLLRVPSDAEEQQAGVPKEEE